MLYFLGTLLILLLRDNAAAMPLLTSRVQSIAFRNSFSETGSILRHYSKYRRALTPLAFQKRHNQPFSSGYLLNASSNSQSPKEAAEKSGARAPSIKEKLPDPERTPFRFREFDLESKVFVVTGGAGGLGLALAEALIEAGGTGEFSRVSQTLKDSVVDLVCLQSILSRPLARTCQGILHGPRTSRPEVWRLVEIRQSRRPGSREPRPCHRGDRNSSRSPRRFDCRSWSAECHPSAGIP